VCSSDLEPSKVCLSQTANLRLMLIWIKFPILQTHKSPHKKA